MKTTSFRIGYVDTMVKVSFEVSVFLEGDLDTEAT